MSYTEDIWQNELICGCFNNPINCLIGCFCPAIALSLAKSRFDGSDFCFNCVCFSCSPLLVRNYIRQGYGISGRVGCGDCLTSAFCPHCVSTQLLNEVDARGPKIVSVQNEQDGPFLAPERDYSCSGDMIDCCCVTMNLQLESAGLYSLLLTVPMWVAYGTNVCQVKHMTRKLYGIGGNDCMDDCVKPTLCACNCCYIYKVLQKVRAEVHYRGNPPIFQKIQMVNTGHGPSVIQPQYIAVSNLPQTTNPSNFEIVREQKKV